MHRHLLLPLLPLLAAGMASACDGVTDATRRAAPPAADVSAQSTAGCVALEFDQDGVLPSAQGFTYDFAPPESEGTYFQVSGGMLHMNTLGSNAVAAYSIPDAFDPDVELTLEFRVRVLPGTEPFGVDFVVSDDITGRDFEFGFTSGGVLLPPPPNSRPLLPFDVTGDFHTYHVHVDGGSSVYQLTIDGVPAASATVSGGDPVHRLFQFGDLTGDYDGAADIDFIRYCQARTIQVDVKPGDAPNSINPRSLGVIPVAVLTDGDFDAATLDPSTVRFGATGTEAAPVHVSSADVDGDADLDAIFHFETRQTGIACGTTSVALTGKTFAGTPVRGTDSVRTVGCR
ncbi:MAG: hypothetical protein ACJ8GN_08550 [Longimicrobiaceae bacterium]